MLVGKGLKGGQRLKYMLDKERQVERGQGQSSQYACEGREIGDLAEFIL